MTPRPSGWALRAFAAFLLLLSRGARADPPPSVALAGGLGYAFPAGGLERGSQLSDITLGLVDISVDGAYRLHQLWSAGAALHYGASIPKLCASGSDCISSIGRDVRVGALGRWHPGRWRSLEPDVDLEFGYEWLATKLVDNDAVSRRGARGFAASLAAHGQFALWRHVSIGPVLAVSGGIFSRASLDAPGVATARNTDGSLVHLWTYVGFRTCASW